MEARQERGISGWARDGKREGGDRRGKGKEGEGKNKGGGKQGEGKREGGNAEWWDPPTPMVCDTKCISIQSQPLGIRSKHERSLARMNVAKHEPRDRAKHEPCLGNLHRLARFGSLGFRALTAQGALREHWQCRAAQVCCSEVERQWLSYSTASHNAQPDERCTVGDFQLPGCTSHVCTTFTFTTGYAAPTRHCTT